MNMLQCTPYTVEGHLCCVQFLVIQTVLQKTVPVVLGYWSHLGHSGDSLERLQGCNEHLLSAGYGEIIAGNPRHNPPKINTSLQIRNERLRKEGKSLIHRI